MNNINNTRSRTFSSVVAAVLIFVTVFSGLGLYGADNANAEKTATVTITFHGNGGAWEAGEGGDKKTVKVSAGTIWNNNLVPQGLTRPNHTLLGWSLSPSSTAADYVDTTIEGDVELYAVWRDDTPPEEQVTVTFNPQGGLNPPVPVTIKKGTALGEKWPKNLMIKPDFEFVGWATAPGMTTPDFQKDTIVNEDIAVYAIWKPVENIEKTKVIFNPNGGNLGNVPAEVEAIVGQALGEKMPNEAPTREKHEFVGWAFSDSATESEFDKDTVVEGETMVYAVWKPEEEENKPPEKPMGVYVYHHGDSPTLKSPYGLKNEDLTWTSTNSKIVAVNAGKLTTKYPGMAYVKGVYKNKTYVYTIKVRPKAVSYYRGKVVRRRYARLSWSPSPGMSGIFVYRAVKYKGKYKFKRWLRVRGVSKRTAQFYIKKGKRYAYRIRAYKLIGKYEYISKAKTLYFRGR